MQEESSHIDGLYLDTLVEDYRNDKYNVVLKIKKKNKFLNDDYSFYFIQNSDTIRLYQNCQNSLPLPLTNTKLLIKLKGNKFVINDFDKHLNPTFSNLIIILKSRKNFFHSNVNIFVAC